MISLSTIVRFALIVLGAGVGLTLSACAHKDLTAPCTARAIWGGAFAADDVGCGPMRPIN
jgi:hypothetical protein